MWFFYRNHVKHKQPLLKIFGFRRWISRNPGGISTTRLEEHEDFDLSRRSCGENQAWSNPAGFYTMCFPNSVLQKPIKNHRFVIAGLFWTKMAFAKPVSLSSWRPVWVPHAHKEMRGLPPGAQWQTEATLQDAKHHLDTDSRWLKDPYEPVISIIFTKASKVLIGGVNTLSPKARPYIATTNFFHVLHIIPILYQVYTAQIMDVLQVPPVPECPSFWTTRWTTRSTPPGKESLFDGFWLFLVGAIFFDDRSLSWDFFLERPWTKRHKKTCSIIQINKKQLQM